MSSTADNILASLAYGPVAGRRDEAMDDAASVREHWQYLIESLQVLGPEALTEREAKARRILRDDGAIYHIYGDPSGQGRIWSLDPVPLLIGSEEWREVEAGLLERAEVLNLLLRDLYGPRELIRHRVLPPELVFHSPAFRRACHGIQLPGEHELIIHATDMARADDGRLWVIGDRTQAPSGAGYALENRVVMSRVFPSLFRDSHVHRLAWFFRALRQKVNAIVPVGAGEPRVVVLTPGPFNETYFEHAYLANYLGYALVQGADLVCQDGYVWMRSVGGLERVDGIIRRVDDGYCDPVELKGDSQLGVAGLLEVARSGRVAIINPLGAGVIENPAMLKYFPAITQHFLGRKPRLPTVRAWWCGDAADREYVLDNLDRLVIKPTYRSAPLYSRFGAMLSDSERQRLREQILNKPFAYAAQEPIVPSTTPSWQDSALHPRPAVLRGFAVAAEGGYVVMPGGLTRVGTALDAQIVSNQTGSISKDTWVLASEPEKLPAASEVAQVTRAVSDHQMALPGRAVENLFWMARYAERAECSIRLLRTVFVQLNRNLAAGDKTAGAAQKTLLRAVTDVTATYPGFYATDREDLFSDPDKELLSIMLDADRTGSVTGNLKAMLSAAAAVQELMSADTQRVINDIQDEVEQLQMGLAGGLSAAPEEALDPLVTALMALSGLANESMTHGIGWRFMDMGRRVERSLLTATLLRSTLFHSSNWGEETSVIETVLLSMENLITYRRRYHGQMDVTRGLALLMTSSTNPRSLLYQLERLRSHVDQIPYQREDGRLSSEARLVLEASTLVQLADLADLAAAHPETGERDALHQLLSRVTYLVGETSNMLTRRFFEKPQQLQQLVAEPEIES